MFPTAILRSIHNTLLLPHMSYCILSWGSQIDKIRLLQKRAIRNVTKSAYTAHTEPLHKEHNINDNDNNEIELYRHYNGNNTNIKVI